MLCYYKISSTQILPDINQLHQVRHQLTRRVWFVNSLSQAIKIQRSKFECAGYTSLF